ncbi:hypothetical protein BRADI_1g05328v3, partial [Brachypodium distachyon]
MLGVVAPIAGQEREAVAERAEVIGVGPRLAAGKRKALEGGPWSFNNDLLVLEDIVPTKTIKEYAFEYFPIWVRIFDVPLGIMDWEAGVAIGGMIGEVQEVGRDESGSTIGGFLRIKVKIKRSAPLMRGVSLEVEEEMREEEDALADTARDGQEADGGEEGASMPHR